MSDEQRRFSASVGVSAIVKCRDGDVGMVVDQRPAGAHRYKVLFPGRPVPIYYRADDLEVLQSGDLDGWWQQGPRIVTEAPKTPTYRLTLTVHRYGPIPRGQRFYRDVTAPFAPAVGENVTLYAEDGTVDGDGPTAAVRKRWYDPSGRMWMSVTPFDVDPAGSRLQLIQKVNETEAGGWRDSEVWLEATDGDIYAALTGGGWQRWR